MRLQPAKQREWKRSATFKRDAGRLASSDLPATGGDPVRPRTNPLLIGTPCISSLEIESVTRCLQSRWIGAGARVEQFEEAFARYKGAPHAVAVSSGTAALHLSMVALGIGPGDEVIAPTMTFCATVNSILHTGATPVLADCQHDTYNVDPSEIEKRITHKTKAVVLVHMAGRCCAMDEILEIAKRHRLMVIEDCAHAIESSYRGKPAGLMGDAGCFSFYATKNITTGDGGMVIARDEQLARRVKLLSLHGMTLDAWSRTTERRSGYQVVAAGYKCNMTDISAALGLAQIAGIEAKAKRRAEIWQMYNERLSELPVSLPARFERDSRHALHLYSVLVEGDAAAIGRDRVVAGLAAENIGTGIHYVPVHMHPYYRKRFGFRATDFPNAADIGRRTISLPLSPEMIERDVNDVCEALRRVVSRRARLTASRKGKARSKTAAA